MPKTGKNGAGGLIKTILKKKKSGWFITRKILPAFFSQKSKKRVVGIEQGKSEKAYKRRQDDKSRLEQDRRILQE